MTAPEIVTFGCRLNIAESEAIGAALAGESDLVVINSCAVTAEAVVNARKAIRRAARARPGARIVVTGCASEIDRAMFADMAEVAGVVPNAAKLNPVLYRPPGESRDPCGEALPTGHAARWIPASAGMTGERGTQHARHFLPIQNGCDHRCTFCIIPYGRGPSRSLPAGGVVAAARAAVAAGVREIVLTGVDLTAYGADLPGRPTLGMLVERLLRLVPDLPRLRLSSLDPCEVDDRLVGLFASEERLMPHAHLSLQAGDDLVLKRMKRRHLRGDAVALVERLKAARPGIAIGADLIAGFPTESDAAFANTRALIAECDIVLAHIFPYSPRAGTPAARMPQVARETVRARAADLRAVAQGLRDRWLAGQAGSVQAVLVELNGVTGHAQNFAKVRIVEAPLPLWERGWGEGASAASQFALAGIEPARPIPSPQPSPTRGEGVLANTILPTRIIGVDGDTLIGVPA